MQVQRDCSGSDGAGVDLLKKLGESVAVTEPLYRVHAEYPADNRFARELCDANSGYTIDEASSAVSPAPHP